MKQKLYLCSATCSTILEIISFAATTFAASEEEAIGKIIAANEKRFPPADGWGPIKVVADEITPALIDKAYILLHGSELKAENAKLRLWLRGELGITDEMIDEALASDEEEA
jgi:hypothetical protein